MRRVGWLVFFCLTTAYAYSQTSTVLETNAPGVKWHQINTPNFRLLYPEGFEVQAQRMANTLETIRTPESKTMGTLPKKISVILQNQSSFSNGFVTMAPRRSEFYTMPAQNYNFIGTNDWMNNLAVHEYRHMVQFQRSITGFNKAFYYLFGQQATAGFAFAAAPQWFWEGDAVATETAFTQSGRGRIPNFDILFRTNAMEGRTFNYHKQYLRSYKHNIPDHYVLGYNMVAHLRRKTNDPEIWEKVVGRSWSAPFIPFAFSNALKKETGMYVTDVYRDMAKQRQEDYQKAIEGLVFTPFDRLTKRKSSAYTDYMFPQVLENGNIVAVKSGIGDIDQLVVLSRDGKEEKKYVQGIVNEAGMLSATNMRVVWNEYRLDPRWLVHNYSMVKGYDFGTRKATIVSNHSRYSAAALSPDGYRVATIETTTDYSIRLVILDYFSGRVLQTLPNAGNDLLAMPHWTSDGNGVVMLSTNKDGKTMIEVQLSSGLQRELLPRSMENIGYPVPFMKYVFFNSPEGGIDNIHVINLATGKRSQVTTSRYGAYNPCISRDGTLIFYNDQTRDGIDVVSMPFDSASWKPFVPAVSAPNLNFQHLVEQEGNSQVLSQVPSTIYETKRYRRASGMINPHSWGPYLVNSLTQVNIGITSQDILSTTRINVGYTYDLNERTGQWGAGISYQGFFPILDFRATKSDRSVNEGLIDYDKVVGTDTTATVDTLNFSWSEKTLEAGIRIPLLLTRSKYLSSLDIANNVGFSWVSDFKNSVDGGGRVFPANYPQYFFRTYQDNGLLKYNHFSMSAYHLLKRSRRDINSKWGQTIFIDYFNTPYGGDFSGGQFSVLATLYLPGLFKHHSLWTYWAYQNSQIYQAYADGRGLDNYLFRNQIPLPRGQSVSRFEDFYTLATNYTFPVWYPDIAVGPLVNIQRIRANGFFDYGFGQSVFPTAAFSQTYTSVGGELKLDINVMRFLPQFNVGVRYSYGITPSATLFEILIGAFNF